MWRGCVCLLATGAASHVRPAETVLAVVVILSLLLQGRGHAPQPAARAAREPHYQV